MKITNIEQHRKNAFDKNNPLEAGDELMTVCLLHTFAELTQEINGAYSALANLLRDYSESDQVQAVKIAEQIMGEGTLYKLREMLTAQLYNLHNLNALINKGITEPNWKEKQRLQEEIVAFSEDYISNDNLIVYQNIRSLNAAAAESLDKDK